MYTKPDVFLILLLSLFVGAPAHAANESSQNFTLDGQLLHVNSTTPLVDAGAKLTVQILDPSQNCVLYEETQNVNTLATNGFFSIQVGSLPGNAKRTGLDVGQSMQTIIQNFSAIPGSSAPGKTCTSATYSPSAGDIRYFRITVIPSSGSPDTLAPDMVLDSVPSAIVAQSVQGLDRSNILRTNTASGEVLTQTNLEALFTAAAFANLAPILAGNYVQKGANGAVLPSFPTAPSSPVAGDIWYDSTGKKLVYSDGTTNYTLSNAGSGVTSITTSANLSVNGVAGATLTTTGTLDLAALGTAGTYTKVTVDAKGRVSAGTTLVEADIPTLSTAGKVVGTAITSGTIGGSTSISTSGNLQTTGDVTTKRFFLFDHAGVGPNFVGMQTVPDMSVGGASYTLTFPNSAGSANQVLSTNGTGVLSWVTNSDSTRVSKAGDTMTGLLLLSADPVAALGAATKQYADSFLIGKTLPATPAAGQSGQALRWNNATPAWEYFTPGTGTVTNVSSANTDISVATGSTTPVLTLNSGTGNNQIVKLSATAKLPAVDGSQLTNLIATQITSGILPLITGGTGAALAPAGKGEIIFSNSTTDLASLAASTSGYVLTSAGVGNAPTWATPALDNTKVLKAGDTMSGLLVLSADPSAALGASTKQYVDSAVATSAANYIRKDGTVPFTGDQSMGSHKITNLTDPTTAQDAATKNYADTTFLKLIGGTMTGPLINNTSSASTAVAVTQAGAGYAATFMGGNVGVGNPTPGYKLDVTGDVNVTGNFKVNGTNILTGGGTVTNVTSANSYLSVATGSSTPALTVNVGTSANTVAAGNDSRITGALQSATAFSGDVSGAYNVNSVDKIKGTGVAITSITSGNFLRYNGTNWVNTNLSSGDVTTGLGFSPVNKAGDTMSGLLVLSADPSAALGTATKQYVDSSTATSGALFIKKDGSVAFTGPQAMGANKMTGVADPTSAQDAATKNYVDTNLIGKTLPSAPGAGQTGQSLRWNNATPGWEYYTAGTGAGSVTSVAMTVPSVMSVTGSPITTTGTLAVSLNTQTSNQIFAGPASGGALAPTFRTLVGSDLPLPTATTIGGVESIAAVGSKWVNSISTAGVPTLAQPAFADISGSVAATQMPALTGDVTTTAGTVATTIATSAVTNSKLANMAPGTIKGNNTAGAAAPIDLTAAQVATMIGSFSNPMTGSGDLIYGGASGAATRLPASTSGYVLSTNGAGAAPTWIAAPADSTKVAKAGDTMTGALVNNTSSASTALNVTQSGAGNVATFMGGNVGIGTTSPTSTLHVIGTNGTAGAAPTAFTVIGGTGGTNGKGGGISLTAGPGSGSGAGGDVTLVGGAGVGNPFYSPRGNVNINGGDNGGDTNGIVTIRGGNYSTSTGAQLVLNGGNSSATGSATFSTGSGGAVVGNTGSISIITGTATMGYSAGGISFTAGSGSLTGTGGAINITAGAGGATNVNGSNVVINGGAKGGTGADGNVILSSANGNVGIGTTTPGSALDVKGTIKLSGATSGFVGLAPAAAAGSTTYTLPASDGSNGQVLSTNGSGTLSWGSPSGCNIISAVGDWFVPLGSHSISSYNDSNTNPSQTNYGAANTTVVSRFFVPCSFTPGKISFSISTAGAAGCKMEVGVYNAAGTSLLVRTGVATDSTTVACNSTGTKTFTASTTPAASGLGTTYSSGWYILAVTSNDTNLRLAGMSGSGNAGASMLGSLAAISANGNAATTNGSLPSSVSGYSIGVNAVNIPIVALSK